MIGNQASHTLAGERNFTYMRDPGQAPPHEEPFHLGLRVIPHAYSPP